MKNFGVIKNKLLKLLTESFVEGDTDKVKNILKITKSDKDIKELYVLYEDIENKFFEDKEVAKLYVDELTTILKKKDITNKSSWKKLVESIVDVECEENEIYKILDILSESDTLLNIDKKVNAKKKLVDYLMIPKKINITEDEQYTKNESLLRAVLTNNFNVLYSKTLTEDQKLELKNILSITNEELSSSVLSLKEDIKGKIDNLISESNDDLLNQKLNDVINEMKDMGVSRYNYYRLKELKNGLN